MAWSSPQYIEYEALVRAEIEKHSSMPHCDMYVLHLPKTCNYCDNYPELQNFRLKHGMQFTNEELQPRQLVCPAIVKRDMEKIERWGGNIATVMDTDSSRSTNP